MPDKPANMAKILIVDDEPGVRELLLELLSGQYTCDTTASAEAALKKLGQHEYAVVISDIDMPGSSGLELTAKAKELAPRTAVLLTSGNAAAGYAEKALEAGACGFIEKPFDLAAVETAVEEAVKRHQESTEKKSGEADRERAARRDERRSAPRDYQSFGNAQLNLLNCH